MPRVPRVADGNVIYHVLNRRVGREPLFLREGDWLAFLALLGESVEREAEPGATAFLQWRMPLVFDHCKDAVAPGDGRFAG